MKEQLTVRCKIDILFFTISIFFCNGCQKDSINGDLDGRWQIMEISNIEDSMKNRQLYYNFYLHVCSLSYYGGVYTEGNLHVDENHIYLYFPYINTANGLKTLELYGIYSNPVTFEIAYLDRKKLIMKEGDLTITLRKF